MSTLNIPVSMRQPTPGPSTPISAALQPQIRPGNSKKRSGSEVTEDMRDAKKVKVEGAALSTVSMNGKQKEKDKKKKKKKKRRRTSVVVAITQSREREAPNSTVPPTSVPQRESPEPTNGHAKNESADETVLSSSDKGKGKASSKSPRRVATPVIESEQPVASGSGSSNSIIAPDQNSEINRLKEQLASQTSLLERHQTHLSNHQQALTCQICLDLMYKPYALTPCGHITCYGCLVRWFTSPTNPGGTNPGLPDAQNEGIEAILNNPAARNGAYLRRRKNCPVCRAVISERPIEMWGIKSMVAALVRSGLAEIPVPLEPAVEENVDNNSDPWRNIFRRAGPPNGRPFVPVDFAARFGPPAPDPAAPADERAEMGWYDAEDGGIYRCNDCYHEILYGRCTRCQRVYPGHMGYDDDDDDDDDFDADELHIRGGIQRFIDALMDDANEDEDEDDEGIDEDMLLRAPWDLDPEDDEDEEELMDGPQHPRDDLQERDIFGGPGSEEEDEHDYNEDFVAFANRFYLPHEIHPPMPRPRRAARIEEFESDEEGSDYEGSFIDDGAEHEDDHVDQDIEVVDDDDSEDDEVDALDRPPGQPRPAVLDITDSEDEDVDEDDRTHRRPRPSVRIRPQTLVISSDEDEDVGDDDDVPDAQYHPRTFGRNIRSRNIVVEDDEDDSDSHAGLYQGEEGEEEDGHSN